MESMQAFVNCSAQLLIISVALVMMLDFIGGAIHLFNNSAPTQTIAHSKPETESAMPEGYDLLGIASFSDRLAVPPEDNGSSQTPTLLESAGCDALKRVSSQPATLRWLLPTIKPDILDATEPPNVIEMARVRQLKILVKGGGQPEREMTELGIRELKKRASAAKIKRYNIMTKNQLIDQLLALGQLTA